MNVRASFVILSLTLLVASPAVAGVSVIDGDTLDIDGTIYRIHGIDAPEVGQKCASSRGSWQCGKDAALRLAELVQGRQVTCDTITQDRYERDIATCTVGTTDLGAQLVSEGLAWAYVRFTDKYSANEAEARSARLGIWSALNQPAWDFREEQWKRSVNTSPRPGCPIKGNISENGKIYHTPWSPWYDRTRISESKGERWFCDELEAVQAGWRAPRWP